MHFGVANIALLHSPHVTCQPQDLTFAGPPELLTDDLHSFENSLEYLRELSEAQVYYKDRVKEGRQSFHALSSQNQAISMWSPARKLP